MKSKGFTLIELIALIGIISIIVLLGAPSLINQIETTKKNKYTNFVSDLCLAAESYINHSNSVSDEQFQNPNDVITINLNDLISNGYVKSSVINPNTKQKLTGNEELTVRLTEDMTYSCTLGE